MGRSTRQANDSDEEASGFMMQVDNEVSADVTDEVEPKLSNDLKVLLATPSTAVLEKYDMGPDDIMIDSGSEINCCRCASVKGVTN